MGKIDSQEEDLAIQDTLQMTAEERIELLAALIVDRVAEDQAQGGLLYQRIGGVQHD